MSDMDSQTLKYYSSQAEMLAGRYDRVIGGISDYFRLSFEERAKILDIGCGSGRDLKILHEMGYLADGVDPCDEFVEFCNKNKTGYGSIVKKDSLPGLASIQDKSYDGILCSATLMHLPKEQLFDASFAIRRILRENGRLLISIPLHDETIDEKTKRDTDGRLFNSITPENFQLIFERIGFTLINRWDNDDSLGRQHRRWATMLFSLRNPAESRPIDTIESILNRDKKTATYKLALFRALAEIAITNYNLAKWMPNGKVKIPIQAVAEKWMEYFWPLLEAKIKQSTGNPVAFGKSMAPLIEFYGGNKGGLSRFLIEYKNEKLPPNALELSNKLLRSLRHTIWNQPIRYAGGGSFSIFQYDKGDKTIIVGADLWRELSLTGAWITDATILRWAELTERISNKTIKASQVIDCLLSKFDPDRDVHSAKMFYDAFPSKTCVWSRIPLSKEYAIDHAIPFSLWKNNDLWNLFPTNNVINGKKKDKLPTRELIISRKEDIVYYWKKIKEEFPLRFKYEARGLIGEEFHVGNWENNLFANFAEAIEITAFQRGIERWQPEKSYSGLAASHPSKRASGTVVKGRGAQIKLLSYEDIRGTEFISVLPLIGKLAAGASDFGFFFETFEKNGQLNKNSLGECDWIELPDDLKQMAKRGRFIIQVAGDSMAPAISRGDYLVCEYHRHFQLGSPIVIMADFSNSAETGESAIKRIKETEDAWIFRSDNKKYKDRIIRKLDINAEYPILGIVLYNLTRNEAIK